MATGPEVPAAASDRPLRRDFCCASAKLVIEVDGFHHTDAARIERDERRDAHLRERGFRVLRIPAAEVFRDVDEVVQGIVQAALAPPPSRR